jgi:hypothetical protein
MRRGNSKVMLTTGPVVSGAHNLLGFLIGTDGVNDPRFSLHNGEDETGKEVVPSTTYDASQWGPMVPCFRFISPAWMESTSTKSQGPTTR